MKKKVIALTLTAIMCLTAVVGGTLAYFTDTDAKTNTFTSGNVDITLNEKFDAENAKLLPGKENAVQKEVSIKNVGSENAYVWYEWLIPAELDSTDGLTGTNNFVHVNSFGYTWDKYRENEKYFPEDRDTALDLEWTWDHDPEVELKELGVTLSGPEGFIGTEEIEGVTYNKYIVLYHGLIVDDEETTPAMSQVYLDKDVDTNADGDYFKGDKVVEAELLQDFDIIVRAYAIQAAGFDSVYEAYIAYNAQ